MILHILKQLSLLALVLILATTLGTPRSQISDCPKVSIECPTDLPESGRTYTVKVKVEGGNPNQKLTYKWAVSSGEIVDGQGTFSVSVRIGDRGESITATVEVGGLPNDCGNVASCTFVMT